MPDTYGNLTDEEKELLGLNAKQAMPQPSVPAPQPRGEDPQNPAEGMTIESPLPPAIDRYQSLFPKDDVFNGIGIDQLAKRSSDAIKNRLMEGDVGEEANRSPASTSDEDSSEEAPSTPVSSKKSGKKELSAQDMKDLQTRLSNARPGMNTSDAINTLLGQNASAMQGAQQAANSNRLLAMLGEAGSTIGSALTPLSKEKPNHEFFNKLEQSANQPIQDVLTQQASQQSEMKGALQKRQLQEAMESSDPTSDKSQALRKAYEKAFPGIAQSYGKYWESVSASDAPLIAHPLELRAKLDEQRTNALANREFKQKLLEGKSGDADEKMFKSYTDAINPAKASSRTPMGRSQIVVDAATKIQQLFNQYPDLNKMPHNQLVEVAKSMDSMLSNGAPSVAGTEALVPKYLLGDSSKIASYISSSAKGAGGASFLNNFKDTINREQAASRGIVRSYQTNLRDSVADSPYVQRNPERFSTINKSMIKEEPSGKSQQNPANSSVGPGSIVQIKGKTYQVGDDGNTLKEIP